MALAGCIWPWSVFGDGRRVALVVGNNAYTHGAPLSNAVRDARLVADVLGDAGFEVVVGEDVDRDQFIAKRSEFAESATSAAIQLFFYSGHGLEVDGQNYLVPVDIRGNLSSKEVKLRTMPLAEITDVMGSGAGALKIIILDCCRNNPLGRGDTRALASVKGLAPPTSLADSTVIFFATYPGGVTADDSGFTPALVEEMKKPGLSIFQVIQNTIQSVRALGSGEQQPWYSSNCAKIPFSFFGGRPGEFENSLEMRFVEVLMPAEGRSGLMFCIWETRVRDFRQFLRETGGTEHVPFFDQGETHPIVGVTFDEAEKFCVWLTDKERREGRIAANERYRLPRDWEWSVAAGMSEARERIPSENDLSYDRTFPWGVQECPPRGAGNYGNELGADEFRCTAPVGSFEPNLLGLYDMGGNAWEWCSDDYGVRGMGKVLRGASWCNAYRDVLLSSFRLASRPDARVETHGFRCVLERQQEKNDDVQE